MGARSLCTLALMACIPWSASSGRPASSTPTLDEILARLEAVADLYVSQAVEFSCVEVIRWRTYDSGGRIIERKGQHRSNYLFTRSEAEGLDEIRAPKRARSLDQVKGHVERSDVPLYVERAYFWIVLFHAGERERYAFSIEEQLVHKGRPAVRIRFEPVPPIEEGVNDWYGTALVDVETFQLLAAEGLTASNQQRVRDLEEMRRSPEDLPVGVDDRTVVITSVATDFDVEKKGVRFPSEVRIDKTIYRVRGSPGYRKTRRIPIHEVRQIYKDYRFYDVDLWDEVGVKAELPVEAAMREVAPSDPTAARERLAEQRPQAASPSYQQSFDLSPDDPDFVFDLEEEGFLLGDEDTQSWHGRLLDGCYLLSNPWRAGDIYVQPFEGTGDSANATFTARIKLVKHQTDGQSAAGLVYRFSPSPQSYYAFVLTPRGEIQFWRRSKLGFTELFSATVDDFRWDRFFELTVRGETDQFQLGLDGELLGVVRDDRISVGQVGIIAIARGSFAFDDLKLVD